VRDIVAGHGEMGAREPFTEIGVAGATLMKTAPREQRNRAGWECLLLQQGPRPPPSSPRDRSAPREAKHLGLHATGLVPL